jgi:dTDP-4-amino-4,6-dideoxygalactose transaminase
MHIYYTKASIFRKDLESVLETMLTDKFGPARFRHVKEFEKELAEYTGHESAAVVNSGSAAIHLAFLGLGIGKDDEVIVPSYAESAVLHIINYVGAKAVVADINHNNFGLSHDEVKKLVTPRTRALYVPHLFGFPVDVSVFQEFNVPVIEDITDALGAEFKGVKIGLNAAVCVASFSDEKMITTGQGGAILSVNKKLIQTVRELVDYQNTDPYAVRYNYRLSDLLAALGINQLKYLPKFIEKRQQISDEYARVFRKSGIEFFDLPVDRFNTWYKFVVILQGGVQKTLQFLKKARIEAQEPVRRPLHKVLGLDPGLFPNTELAFHKCLSLPIYPTLKKHDVERIAAEVCKSLY